MGLAMVLTICTTKSYTFRTILFNITQLHASVALAANVM